MNKESIDKNPVINPAFEFPPDIIFYCEAPETFRCTFVHYKILDHEPK